MSSTDNKEIVNEPVIDEIIGEEPYCGGVEEYIEKDLTEIQKYDDNGSVCTLWIYGYEWHPKGGKEKSIGMTFHANSVDEIAIKSRLLVFYETYTQNDVLWEKYTCYDKGVIGIGLLHYSNNEIITNVREILRAY